VAWVVPRGGAAPSAVELIAHAGELLSKHKRPREVRFLEQLPRNPMGKVTKASLRAGD
jgi:malonyl-CoA/methylmalonyl-CoA synthetase